MTGWKVAFVSVALVVAPCWGCGKKDDGSESEPASAGDDEAGGEDEASKDDNGESDQAPAPVECTLLTADDFTAAGLELEGEPTPSSHSGCQYNLSEPGAHISVTLLSYSNQARAARRGESGEKGAQVTEIDLGEEAIRYTDEVGVAQIWVKVADDKSLVIERSYPGEDDREVLNGWVDQLQPLAKAAVARL